MDIFTTMITPYTADGRVDFETAERYVDWYFENGLTGIFAVCQSSEIFYLTLEERVELNARVYARAKALEKASGRRFTVVSSGHVSDSFEDQVTELSAVWESGTDALILITNRLDPNNEGDDVFIANAERLLAALPDDVKLGLYECPYPYKRLVTPKILDWCLSTGKFYYMKDTCCDAALIAERVRQLAGSQFKLLNANCQTLLETMRAGAHGYCGIMCNFHPRLYAWLGEHYADKTADLVQSVIGTFGFTEVGLPYPLTAKYHMNLCGIPTENIA
ncbi:MAG: dihydrodipicolinate synthase family protein, partial [Clostridia bacterium]|nr:dihydrodipicolinate synthase family protein [Clostridia bacterium]